MKQNYFDFLEKNVVIYLKNGKKAKGFVSCVSDQGEDEPEERFVMIGYNGYLFDDIEKIEEIK